MSGRFGRGESLARINLKYKSKINDRKSPNRAGLRCGRSVFGVV